MEAALPRPQIRTITASRFNIRRSLADVDDRNSLGFMMTISKRKRRNTNQRALHPNQNPKSRPGLGRLLRFSPSCCPGSFQRLSPSDGHLPLLLGLLPSFALRGHSLGNSCSHIGKSLGAHLSLAGHHCSLNPRPSCLLSRSHLGSGRGTELVLHRRFNCRGLSRTAQKLPQFFLQRLDLLLDVGCLTKLCWCNGYHCGL